MNPTPRPEPRDDEIDAFLARRYRDTTPGFEARWVALKRDLRTAPPARHPAPWLWWLGAFTVGAAAIALVATSPRRPAPRLETAASPALTELIAMDAVLSRGTALLDVENRDALLHLPSQPSLRN